MSQTVYIFSVVSEHTTARYFHRAICDLQGWRCNYISTLFDLSQLDADDLFFYVDPTMEWPLGLESVPCTTIAYFIDVHQDLRSRLMLSNFFDVVFVAQKKYVPAFCEIGHKNVYWLPLACDAETHNVPSKFRCFDIGFVGALGSQGTQRNKILSSILPEFHTNEYWRYHSPREMGEVYGQSKIVFNASINGDLNMRVFEAMAAGALLITDRISDGLSDLFTEGTHYIAYSTVSDAMEKIRYYLENNGDREAIACAGQLAVLGHHTYKKRLEFIKQRLDGTGGAAPARRFSRLELGALYADVFMFLRQPCRIATVFRYYGVSSHAALCWLKASVRWLNVRIPMTPNAIKSRLNR